MKHGVCKYCGKEFTRKTNHGNDAMMFCSRECSYAYHSQKKKERFKREMESKKIEKVCPVCGNSFVTNLSQKIYCSDKCSYEHQKEMARIRVNNLRPNKFVSHKHICENCGKEFDTQYKHSKHFCSIKCQKENKKLHNHSNSRKRLKGKIVDKGITIRKLIHRDNKICQLCGKPIDETDYSFTSEGCFITGDNYPSIDHIKPLSKGGLHEWENVQLAHFKCNRLKSDHIQ